jgi:hypothetical protein
MTDIGTQPQGRVSLESRRSTRVALKVVIETQGTQGIAGHLTCEGETIIVNLHGALITTSVALSVGMKIEIHVYLTGKRATAKVVYVDPEKPLRCGIELATPRNIWGISLPPKDWQESDLV